MRIGKFGDKYKGMSCEKARGNGASQLFCSVDKKACPFQHFCTKKRIFENVGDYIKCSKRTQK